ncbi:isocitrate lyase/PEP mutase family protein [Actinokineospora sp. 24-640]
MPGVTDQQRKADVFAGLHAGPGVLVLPNPWDAGTARILASLGFAALATTSAGVAFSRGVPDGAVGRDDILANAAEIVAATGLPVSADLGDGFDDPAETVRRAAAVGLVGGSVEDVVGGRVIEVGEAVSRVAAAAEAARDLPFLLTARAENFLYGRADLDDTIARLRAYEEAGADVLYAPGLPDADAIRRVCQAVGKPVNVLAYGAAAELSVAELGELGVRRVSLGSGLARAALAAMATAAGEVLGAGTFAGVRAGHGHTGLNRLMEGGPTPSAG